MIKFWQSRGEVRVDQGKEKFELTIVLVRLVRSGWLGHENTQVLILSGLTQELLMRRLLWVETLSQ